VINFWCWSGSACGFRGSLFRFLRHCAPSTVE